MELVPQFRTRIGKATAKTDQVKGWPEGVQKDCFVAKMSNGRFGIYKGQKHFREDAGYKAYDSIEAIEQDFHLETIQEAITY